FHHLPDHGRQVLIRLDRIKEARWPGCGIPPWGSQPDPLSHQRNLCRSSSCSALEKRQPGGAEQKGEPMDFGIFIPIGNNGWMMSVNAPQYMPSFRLNRTIAEHAETYGFNFLLSMVKLLGFGGRTAFWDHNLESFTLMAGLAAVTERIQLFASVALPTLHPALVARMATIDDISGGRFGINIVSGW